MKPLALLTLAIATLISFSACGPRNKGGRMPHSAGTKPTDQAMKKPNDPSLPPDGPDNRGTGDEIGNTKPTNPIPDPPRIDPKPQYGIKIEGKVGQIYSPYDPQHRPIDVRNLPPGTEIECPFTPGRHLLVP